MKRRRFLSESSGAAIVLATQACIGPSHAHGIQKWTQSAFESKSLAEAVAALAGTGAPVESAKVLLQAPEIAADGSLVRVSVQSQIPGTSEICLVVEKNPAAMAAVFDIFEGTDAHISATIKMAQTSAIYAFVRVNDKLFYAVREVKVVVGACAA